MRKLRRPSVVPPTLASGPGYAAADVHRKTRAADGTAKLSFRGHWNRADVRGALYAMHGRSCAYCNTSLPRNDRGDVEHFRPKALYWWLAYEFGNYVLACSLCNRVRKRERFWLEAGAVAVDYTGRAGLPTEARLLLDPVHDPVDLWISVDFKADLCGIELTTIATADPTASARSKKTIEELCLNTDPGLVRERIEVSQRMLEDLHSYRNGISDGSALRRRASRFSPHGRTARDVLAVLEPNLIPSPVEEATWLVEDLCSELQDVDAIAAQYMWTKRLQTARDEILWALAVVWRDPDGASQADIAALLDAHSVRARVEPFFQQI